MKASTSHGSCRREAAASTWLLGRCIIANLLKVTASPHQSSNGTERIGSPRTIARAGACAAVVPPSLAPSLKHQNIP